MGWRQYREIGADEFFCIGYDLAMGGNDYSAIVFLSKTNLDIPLIYHAPVLATEATNKILPVLEKIHDITGLSPVIAPERNAGGVYEIDRLNVLNRLNKFKMYVSKNVGNMNNPDENKYGFDTNTATRPKMLADLKDAIDHQLLRIYDKPLINEMYSFIINKQGKPEAESSAHDDLVMACAIAWQLQQTENPKRESYSRPYDRNKWNIS